MKPFIIVAVTLLCLSAGVILSVQKTPLHPSYCDDCVMEQQVVEWSVLHSFKIHTSRTETDTPVTSLLRSHGMIQPHQHHWSQPEVISQYDLETPDAPTTRSIAFLNSPRCYNFLKEMLQYTGKDDVQNWSKVTLQPLMASSLETALRFSRFPESGFGTKDSFLGWWQINAYPVFNHLNAMTVAD